MPKQQTTDEPRHSPQARLRPQATMRDVANAAGVSTATVSHVLNGSRFVSDEVRGRVLAAVESLKYRLDPMARGLRRRQTGMVGVLMPNVNSPLAAEMLSHLDRFASKHGIGIVLAQSSYSIEREREWLETLAAQRLDVLLVWSIDPDGTAIADLQAYGQRLIQIVIPSNVSHVPSIAADLELAGMIGVSHLADHGHRRIAVLPGRRQTASHALVGVRDYAAHAPEDIELIVEASDDTPDDARRVVLDLLRRPDRPQAILTLTIAHFEATLEVVRELDIDVPNDLAFVALTDQPWLRYLQPSITTVREDANGMALAAIELARKMLAGEDVPPVQQLFPPHLIVGVSCGCVPK